MKLLIPLAAACLFVVLSTMPSPALSIVTGYDLDLKNQTIYNHWFDILKPIAKKLPTPESDLRPLQLEKISRVFKYLIPRDNYNATLYGHSGVSCLRYPYKADIMIHQDPDKSWKIIWSDVELDLHVRNLKDASRSRDC